MPPAADTAGVFVTLLSGPVPGHRRHRREGRTGVRSEGQGKSRKNGRSEAAHQVTGKDGKKVRSRLTFYPTGTLGRGLQPQAPHHFVCPL